MRLLDRVQSDDILSAVVQRTIVCFVCLTTRRTTSDTKFPIGIRNLYRGVIVKLEFKMLSRTSVWKCVIFEARTWYVAIVVSLIGGWIDRYFVIAFEVVIVKRIGSIVQHLDNSNRHGEDRAKNFGCRSQSEGGRNGLRPRGGQTVAVRAIRAMQFQLRENSLMRTK